jgi:hypothetical protein
MNPKRLGLLGLVVLLLVLYNGAQTDLMAMRTTTTLKPGTHKMQRYGPSLEWLDRAMDASSEKGPKDEYSAKLDFRVLSSLMVAGLASGFKSPVANLLWMKSDEYWHKGMTSRQNPLMEMVVTLDPQFIEAWSTAGWHWAYNIYADIPMNKAYKGNDQLIREKQERAIGVGLDYLRRGSAINPDTYRLWFEYGYTRAEKAGLYDEETVRLYRIARSKADARDVELGSTDASGKPRVRHNGLDTIGRDIGHLYESMPDLDKALDQYGDDLLQLKGKPQQRALLDAAGEYWHRYGSDYYVIGDLYQGGDATVKAQIKKLVPDVERLIKAQQMRRIAERTTNGDGSQPTGAYVTISARYIPAWKLMKAGKLQEAVNTMIGVMNADPHYHLQGLPVLAKVFEIRGDAPPAIAARLKELRGMEKEQTQGIGLHLLATLYEKMANAAKDSAQKKAFYKLAYETWYRSRVRDELDYYAKENTLKYEDQYHFTPPQAIIDQVNKSRKSGTVDAAPEAPPNVRQYYHSEQDE